MPFNPDKFLAETAPGAALGPGAGDGFNPDKFLADTAPPDEGPSPLESGARGVAQGATLGFADELAGGGEALLDKLRGAHEALGELYAKHRNESRKNFEKAEKANPTAYGAGQLAGGIGSNAALALATGGTSIPEQIALGALGGGIQAAGEAPELNQATLGDVGGGVLLGGAAGAVGGGLGRLAGKGLGAIGSKVESLAGKEAAAATRQIEEKAATEAAKRTSSAVGSAGKSVADANATLRNLREALTDPSVSAEQRAAVEEFLKGPAGQELRQSVVGNALKAAPEKVGAAQTAKALAETAQASEGDYAKQLAEQYGSLDEAKAQVMARVKRYAPRAAMAAATSALGEATGGDTGGVLGAAGGLSVGFAGGPALHAVKRMMLNPAVRRTAFQAIGKIGHALAAEPAVLGRYGTTLATAAAKGPAALGAAHYALAQSDPEYQALAAHLQEAQ